MKIRKVICVVALLSAGSAPASAPAFAQTAAPNAAAPADKVTVTSLLAKNYAISGATAVPSGGAGLFMRLGAKLYFCFVSETRESATVKTEYCKPVE